MPVLIAAASVSAGFAAAAGFFAGQQSKQQPEKRIEDIDDRRELVRFLKKACGSKNTAEYKELYRFLLAVFRRADRDYDGLVRENDFDIMVEMAGAVPRKFAYAPTSAESFTSESARTSYRKKAFQKINISKSGGISFDEWLTYSYEHICQMTSTLDEKDADLGLNTKDRFKDFCVKACKDRRSPQYKQLYDLLIDVFVEADTTKTGKVNAEQFDKMIELAADWPRKFGFAPAATVTYKTPADRIAARNKMFADMDTDKSGTITFEEWLTFAYTHICSKVAGLDMSVSGVPPKFVAGSAGLKAGAGCPYGFGK